MLKSGIFSLGNRITNLPGILRFSCILRFERHFQHLLPSGLSPPLCTQCRCHFCFFDVLYQSGPPPIISATHFGFISLQVLSNRFYPLMVSGFPFKVVSGPQYSSSKKFWCHFTIYKINPYFKNLHLTIFIH